MTKAKLLPALAFIAGPAFAQDDSTQGHEHCIESALSAITIPESQPRVDIAAGSYVQAYESDTHLISVSAQLLPTSSPERERIQFTAKYLDEREESFLDMSSTISFMFNDQTYVEDMGNIFDAGVWSDRVTLDGGPYIPRGNTLIVEDSRPEWAADAATAMAYIWSTCHGLSQTMPLGYDNKMPDMPILPEIE